MWTLECELKSILNESVIDLNECEIDLNESEVDLNESEIDLSEPEHFLKANLDRSEIGSMSVWMAPEFR